MKLYLSLPNEGALKDKVFEEVDREKLGGVSNMPVWKRFKQVCEQRGITVHTVDFWDVAKRESDDILFVNTHPGETLIWRLFYFLKHLRHRGGYILARRRFLYKNYQFFKRRILLHAESPLAMPYVYKNLDRIWQSGVYHKIFLWSRGRGSQYSYFNYYFIRDHDLTSSYFNEPKSKFLVMINSNTAPHSLRDELYGERLRAIRHFHATGVLDLYGFRWDKFVRHPFYFHYKKYVDRIYKGTTDDKLKTLSQYKFSICFENCSYPGYVSEKIFDCLAAGCIPVYLGAPDIESIVPPSCFIDMRKFSASTGGKNYDELYSHLKSLTAADLENYRNSILTFLRDKSSMKGMASLVDEILA